MRGSAAVPHSPIMPCKQAERRELGMGKEKKRRRKLAIDDRVCIEAGLARGQSVTDIGKAIGRSASVVIREIQRNCTTDPKHAVYQATRNVCIHKETCTAVDLCGKGCLQGCHRCKSWLCNAVCPDFEAAVCPRHEKPPYCCNGCDKRLGFGCDYPYRFYESKAADDIAKRRASDSRSGLDCTEEQFAATIAIAKEGLGLGQSPEHIWHAHPGEMAFGARNFYRLMECDVIDDITNLDLPRKVRYKPRKKGGSRDGGIPKELLAGRRYDDFEKLPEDAKLNAVEMDTVEGRQGKDRQCLLTLMVKRIGFQLMILLPDKTAKSVVVALDALEALVGKAAYAKIFGTIVTDRGTEFSDVIRLETGPGGSKRSSVYFCDPQQSQQKPRAERNHSEIRRVLPKDGRSDFDALTRGDVSLLMSHVNCYMRNALGWASPYALAKAVFPQGVLEALGVTEVPPELVNLTPMLIPHAIVKRS